MGGSATDAGDIGKAGRVDWFDPSDDVVLRPENDRARLWEKRHGTDRIDVAPSVVFANDGHGRLFGAVCRELDRVAEVVRDRRTEGYCHYQTPSSGFVTVYRAPDPAPYAAATLEHLASAGARTALFLNGTGSLRPDVPVGSIVLPGELVREEGTSFHYAPPEATLRTDKGLNERVGKAAHSLGVALVAANKHWTTDAIYRETFPKVDRHRRRGVVSVEMELSALAGVAHHRGCALSALLVVTDVASRSHTWGGTAPPEFRRGVERATRVAARVFSDANP